MSTQEVSSSCVLIGITGAIASGKSLVADRIEASGIPVLRSDITAKILMATDLDLRNELRRAFGNEVFLTNEDDAPVNASYLSSKVFGKTPEHQKAYALLNRLVHPRVFDEHQRLIEEYVNSGTPTLCIESALIYTAGIDEAFDYIVAVLCNPEQQIQRAMARSNISEEMVRLRMSQQATNAELQQWADFTIDNTSTIENLYRAVDALLPILRILPPSELDDNDGDEVDNSDEAHTGE